MPKSQRPLSKRIKHRTPEIIVGLTVTTAVVATIYFKTTSRLYANVSPETLEYVREHGELIYTVKGHRYMLVHLDN